MYPEGGGGHFVVYETKKERYLPTVKRECRQRQRGSREPTRLHESERSGENNAGGRFLE